MTKRAVGYLFGCVLRAVTTHTFLVATFTTTTITIHCYFAAISSQSACRPMCTNSVFQNESIYLAVHIVKKGSTGNTNAPNKKAHFIQAYILHIVVCKYWLPTMPLKTAHM